MDTILLIDDDQGIRAMLKDYLETAGFEVILAKRGDEGLRKFIQFNPPIVILDQRLPDVNGIELLKKMKHNEPNAQIIIITGYGEIEKAVKAIQYGALNYLTKPIDLQALKMMINGAQQTTLLKKERTYYRNMMKVKANGDIINFYADSDIMKGVLKMCRYVASKDTTVLIQGETGTGKGILAKYIHQISDRSEAPFIEVNCAAIPENLLESELFGYEPGAFTDARYRKDGLIELANTGTLFLDEIGNMPMTIQGKVLKVIEDKVFRKLGGNKEIKTDIRIIAATNIDLYNAVTEKKFRKDLYYRISTFPIELPPLRERKSDLILIAESFLREIKMKIQKDITGFQKEVLDYMKDYTWPGNIRELKNAIERAAIISETEQLCLKDFTQMPFSSADQDADSTLPYKEAMTRFVESRIKDALRQTNGNQSKAAKILEISRDAFIRRMRKFHINSKCYKIDIN
jgi:two-component system response regulator AtoC